MNNKYQFVIAILNVIILFDLFAYEPYNEICIYLKEFICLVKLNESLFADGIKNEDYS